MADSGGEGNIKVVVRCRPLNSRGPCPPLSLGDFGLALLPFFYDTPGSNVMQSLLVARSLSSRCRGIKRSLILQSQVPRKLKPPPAVQASAKHTTSRLIRVTGRLGRGTNPGIVHKKRCTTIWALNYWNMGSRGLTRVFWLVRHPSFLSPDAGRLTSAMGPCRWTDGYGPPCFWCRVGLFIDSRPLQGSGKSYRSVPLKVNVHTVA